MSDARWWRRGSVRWWFLLVYVTAGMVVVFTILGHKQAQDKAKDRQFQREVVAFCEALNTAHRSFNAFLDQSILNAHNTSGLTPEQKQAAIQKYADLHLLVQKCPPVP